MHEQDNNRSGSFQDDDWSQHLLRLLRNRGVNVDSESSQGDLKTVYLSSAPKPDGNIFVDGGGIIFPFGRKFEDGFEGWKVGERINSKFTVKKLPNGRYELLISDSVVHDVRHADVFSLEIKSTKVQRTLKQIGMAELDVDIEITSGSTFRSSNMYEYKAKIISINAIQPLFDGDFSKLELGDKALVEGKVIKYQQGVNNNYGSCEVQLPGGDVVTVTLWNGYLEFEGGNIDIITPNYPVIGDTVQINTTYKNPGQRYGKDQGQHLFAYFCRSTYLLKGSDERIRAYQEQRRNISAGIRNVESAKDSRDARLILSKLIKSNLIIGSVFYRIAWKKEEIERMIDAIEKKIPNPDERPLNLFHETAVAEELNVSYGIDVYSMSKLEFYNFCMEISNGQRNDAEARGIHYQLIDVGLSKKQRLDVLITAVTNLHQTITGKKVIFANYVDDSGIRKYDEEKLREKDTVKSSTNNLFEQSLMYLSSYTSRYIANLYIYLVKHMDNFDAFARSYDDIRNREYNEREIFDSMKDNIMACIEYDYQEKQILGIRDRQSISLYIANLPFLKNFMTRLKQEGYFDERGAGNINGKWKYLDECISMLERIQEFMRISNFRLN